jgi:hypothetical protein
MQFPSYTVISPPPIYLAVASKSGNSSDVRATATRRTHLCYLSTLRLAEPGDALDVRSVDASPALRLPYPGYVFCRFVVYRRCVASTA